MQTSRDSYQYGKNTKLFFATQCKKDNAAFHGSCAMSGGRALQRAICQWKIEHQLIMCCVKGFTLRNMAGRERDAGHL